MRLGWVLAIALGCGPAATPPPDSPPDDPPPEPPPTAERDDRPFAEPPPAAIETCPRSQCTEPAMGMPNWECPDGSQGGPACVRKDGQCGWTVLECPGGRPQTEPAPPPPPSPPPPATAARHDCANLPAPDTIRSWPVVRVYKRFCGGAAPRNYRPPVELRDLGDGTFVARGSDGRCFRARWSRCRKKCLPPDTPIATPAGEVAVSRLRPGDAVWSVDRAGRRFAAVVLEISSVAVGADHRVVAISLADGRSVAISEGHPSAGGVPVERLRIGADYDGSEIVAIERRRFAGERTYDLLPSGPTGVYVASGIPLGSTLR